MKRRLFSLTMILVLAMGMAATGWASGTTGFSVQLTQAKATAATAANPALLSNLRGSPVYDSSHQQIGTVDAVVINTNTSQIQYVVVGTGGGVLGMGSKDIPVPWADVQVTQANAQQSSSSAQSAQYTVTVNISKTVFDQAPQIDLSKLQNQGQLSVTQPSSQSSSGSSGSQSAYGSSGSQSSSSSSSSQAQAEQQIQSFWQSNATAMSGATGTSQTTPSGTAQLVLAKSLIGATLQSQAPQQGTSNQGSSQSSSQASTMTNLGQVKDILANLQTGKVEFALVALNQSSSSQTQSSNNTQQSSGYGYGYGSSQPSGNSSTQQSSTSQSSAQQLVPVPLKDLTWTTQGQTLTYTGSQSLQQAPTVTLQQVQNTQNVSWQSKVDNFWGVSAA